MASLFAWDAGVIDILKAQHHRLATLQEHLTRAFYSGPADAAHRNAIAFKRLVVESDRLYLKPLNPNWPDKFINITTDDRIIGVVVGKHTDM